MKKLNEVLENCDKREQNQDSGTKPALGNQGACFVYCLSVDLIGSTQAGLKIPTSKLDRFNKSLVEQISPHLERLELLGVVIKFTGDGWLLMTNEVDKVPALCCLATIMAGKFQDEMNQRTGISQDKIPSLRITICCGRDIAVNLPDGRKDWVGDSARRAVRASGYCLPNEILVDEPLRYLILRDFDTTPVNLEQCFPTRKPGKAEEALVLHVLGKINSEVVADSEVPECYVYTLETVGKAKEAAKVVQEVSDRLRDKVVEKHLAKEDAQVILRMWTRLMGNLFAYSLVLDVLKSILDAGLKPDVVTYSTLIDKAPDYDTARTWLEKMTAEGIQPNVVTYSTLIDKAPDYDTARTWLEKMTAEGIQPNVVTYSTLIDKAPDYDTARTWLEKMTAEGIQPNVVTHNTLIAKAPDYDTARTWFEKMTAEGIQPNVVTYNTLVNISPDYDTALKWYEEMTKRGISPNEVTCITLVKQAPDFNSALTLTKQLIKDQVFTGRGYFSALFAKDITHLSGEELLEIYNSLPFRFETSLEPAIKTYVNRRKLDDALRLCLFSPHLPAAVRLYKLNPEKCLAWFRDRLEKEPGSSNGLYGLGICLFTNGYISDAEPHLRQALILAYSDKRKEHIENMLHEITKCK